MALFGSSNAPASSEDVKAAIVKQLQQEAALANARILIAKVNEHCFERCIPAPGSSLSSGEQTCLSSCMEKYISLWNVASKTYVGRATSESKKVGQDIHAMAALGTGNSE
ncbi:hypothetical protein ASPZODRAFT_132062 [Penicilliopsis zonata CBS 506.65]|uniref:Mitochondrial import inner membrane translocase subunit n=1 Tax=Penicilliopsis zonata CBS 506.65 TaxID=1073090 RepID=A0A1L9SJ04_9EURO|nr:hypothetical protein ASPZODRAFT_132062 [Penicilliopsis zonata CBS 506.65]OJJ47117.1 hypothetical protein ASPZODRAFT_132062 [Penicilliopsis zonata CBS 506.65]